MPARHIYYAEPAIRTRFRRGFHRCSPPNSTTTATLIFCIQANPRASYPRRHREHGQDTEGCYCG
jgi:hypothetical protein